MNSWALHMLSTGCPTDLYSWPRGPHSLSMSAYTFSLKAQFLKLDFPDLEWDKLCNQTDLSLYWVWRRKPCSSWTWLLRFLPCKPPSTLDPRTATGRQRHTYNDKDGTVWLSGWSCSLCALWMECCYSLNLQWLLEVSVLNAWSPASEISGSSKNVGR